MSETFISNLLVENMKTLQDFAKKLCKNSYDADDLFQETALRVLEKENLYNPDTNFLYWAERIMKNIFLNHLEYESIRQTEEIVSEGEPGDMSVDYNLLVEEINSILSDKQKEVFWMYIDGYSIKEISEKTSIPEGTVKSRIFSSKKLLRNELKR